MTAGTRPPEPHEGVLYVEDVTVSFDGFKALKALNLYIFDGELRCIIGPNGAGKTTMMDVITGKTRPDQGSVYFGDRVDLLGLGEAQIANLGIGRKFQKPTVFEQQSVFENLELAHGQKQWLEIGMLLMQEPRLLLVDEPVAGMTGAEMERTAELLVGLAGRHSVVVVEHDMDFVRSIARTVTVLHQGSVLAEGDMATIQRDPRVIEVYLGE